MAERDLTKFDKLSSFGDLEFEQFTHQVWRLLIKAKVERTSEVIQLATGDFQDELGLIILISPDAMELRLPTLDWSGPHTPVNTSRLWQRLALDELKESQLSQLIVEAQAQQ